MDQLAADEISAATFSVSVIIGTLTTNLTSLLLYISYRIYFKLSDYLHYNKRDGHQSTMETLPVDHQLSWRRVNKNTLTHKLKLVVCRK